MNPIISLTQDIRSVLDQPNLPIFEPHKGLGGSQKLIGSCGTFHPSRTTCHLPFENPFPVKEYRRTETVETSEHVRPPEVLRRCVVHLIETVLSLLERSADPLLAYDAFSFLDDRLRAVRKDFSIQQRVDRDLYETMLRAHILRVALCGRTPSDCRKFIEMCEQHNRDRILDCAAAIERTWLPLVFVGYGPQLRVALETFCCPIAVEASSLLEQRQWLEYCALCTRVARGGDHLAAALLTSSRVMMWVRWRAISDFAFSRRYEAVGGFQRCSGVVKLEVLREKLLFVSIGDLMSFLGFLRIQTEGDILKTGSVPSPGVRILRGMVSALAMPVSLWSEWAKDPKAFCRL